MNRRQFTTVLGAGALGLGLGRVVRSSASPPQFAITMDDFAWHNAVHLTAEERNRAILEVLSANRAKVALFVVGGMVDTEARGKALLRSWDESGHIIGNHTYSHRFLGSGISTTQYERDILHAEEVLKDFKQFQRVFRYPLLKEGSTAAMRDHVRTFLKQHGYRIGHVTIDNSDWIVDQRLAAKLQKDPNADVKPYRDFYLAHMWDRAQYYNALAKEVLGRPVKHTVLTHFNLLNGMFLGDVVEMFRSKGWQLIDADDAFTDPVFRAEPKIVPAGESIVWALAKEKGTIAKSLRYPGEDGDYEKAKMDRLGL